MRVAVWGFENARRAYLVLHCWNVSAVWSGEDRGNCLFLSWRLKFYFLFLWPTVPLKMLCILFAITVVCHSSIHATKLNVHFRLLATRTSIVLVLARLMCRRLLLTSTGKVPSHALCELCNAFYSWNKAVICSLSSICGKVVIWTVHSVSVVGLLWTFRLSRPSFCRASLWTRSSYSAGSGFRPLPGGQMSWSIFL